MFCWRSKSIIRIFNKSLANNFCSKMNPDKSDVVVVEKLDRITTIGINRPEKRNCVNVETATKLKNAFYEFEQDDESYVAILYGTGGNFCAGYDLSELASAKHKNVFVEEGGYMGPTHRIIKKPVIAAVNGYAVAGGMELALFCDLRVMEETAVMGVFNRRFGVPLIDGATVRLQAIVGFSRAMDLILTGRALNAKEAFEIGIANRLVACGTAYGQAIHLANSIIKYPQKCLNVDRAAMYYSTFSAKSFEDAIENEKQSLDSEVLMEAIDGAERFKKGIGKHGKFQNINEKPKKEWESKL